jgi:ubiquinone/menaquinone biosynthesis C-methylase UbiE
MNIGNRMMGNNLSDHNIKVYRQADAIKFYEDFSSLYDKEKRVFEKYYADCTGIRVLDIGCGGGRITRVLKDMGCSVTGVDVSADMVRSAQEKHSDIVFMVMDAVKLKFPDESFDDVWFSFNGLDFIFPKDSRIKALKEIYRVIKPGGKFVYSSHNSRAVLSLRRIRWQTLAWHVLSGRIGSPYREVIGGIERSAFLFHESPVRQVRRLKEVGFERCEIISSYKSLRKCIWSEGWPYFVAHKGK